MLAPSGPEPVSHVPMGLASGPASAGSIVIIRA